MLNVIPYHYLLDLFFVSTYAFIFYICMASVLINVGKNTVNNYFNLFSIYTNKLPLIAVIMLFGHWL